VPAIVLRDLWELAKARMDEGKQLWRRNKVHEYLVDSLINCGQCILSVSGVPIMKARMAQTGTNARK